MKNVIEKIRKELKLNSDEKTRQSGERFFKEAIKLYGVKTAIVGNIGKKYFQEIKDKNKQEIFELCEKLWQSGFMEESFIACNWSYNVHKFFEPKDFQIFENWLKKYVSNWASCDTFCNHTTGTFIEMYPQFVNHLKIWAKSKNRWVRRAAAVTLIVPGKHGKFLSEIFEIADILLEDLDDMVQKGYGWMLKVASQIHQKQVFTYVMKHKSQMPRTALRYAIEKMPQELKAKAMEK